MYFLIFFFLFFFFLFFYFFYFIYFFYLRIWRANEFDRRRGRSSGGMLNLLPYTMRGLSLNLSGRQEKWTLRCCSCSFSCTGLQYLHGERASSTTVTSHAWQIQMNWVDEHTTQYPEHRKFTALHVTHCVSFVSFIEVAIGVLAGTPTSFSQTCFNFFETTPF